MAPIGGRPFLQYQLATLRREGITDVILCVGYRRSQIMHWFDDGGQFGMRLTYSPERRPLGTGGALKKAAEFIPSYPVIVVNGDSLLEVQVKELVAFHRRRKALATIALARVAKSDRYGSVQVDKHGRISSFREKDEKIPEANSRRRFHLINGGVYVFGPEVFDMLPANKKISLEQEVFPQLLTHKTYGYLKTGYFIDIGVPADFLRAQCELPRRVVL